MVGVHSNVQDIVELFFSPLTFPKTPEMWLLIETALESEVFFHHLNQCHVSKTAISDRLNDSIYVNYP